MSEPLPELSPTERLEKVWREANAQAPEDELCAVGGSVYPEDGE